MGADYCSHYFLFTVILMKKILVLDGPNLNMTGIRKKSVYGGETLKQINHELKLYGKVHGAKVSFFQSNHEGDIIDVIHESRDEFDAVSYTHLDVYKRQLLPLFRICRNSHLKASAKPELNLTFCV